MLFIVLFTFGSVLPGIVAVIIFCLFVAALFMCVVFRVFVQDIFRLILSRMRRRVWLRDQSFCIFDFVVSKNMHTWICSVIPTHTRSLNAACLNDMNFGFDIPKQTDTKTEKKERRRERERESKGIKTRDAIEKCKMASTNFTSNMKMTLGYGADKER